jgi:hypothetical protein
LIPIGAAVNDQEKTGLLDQILLNMTIDVGRDGRIENRQKYAAKRHENFFRYTSQYIKHHSSLTYGVQICSHMGIILIL